MIDRMPRSNRPTKYGRQVTAARNFVGLSLGELADLAGIDKSVIHRIENGRTRSPKRTSVLAIHNALAKAGCMASLLPPKRVDLHDVDRVKETATGAAVVPDPILAAAVSRMSPGSAVPIHSDIPLKDPGEAYVVLWQNARIRGRPGVADTLVACSAADWEDCNGRMCAVVYEDEKTGERQAAFLRVYIDGQRALLASDDEPWSLFVDADQIVRADLVTATYEARGMIQ